MMKTMKPQPETIEGPEAYTRFKSMVGKILSVSHEEIVRREKAYKEQAALNPRKRGPKPKQKSAASRDPHA